jgi:hypothetical protein
VIWNPTLFYIEDLPGFLIGVYWGPGRLAFLPACGRVGFGGLFRLPVT